MITVDGRYFDKNGEEITQGLIVEDETGQKKVIYSTIHGELGTDATNPDWIKMGLACSGMFGIYPLTIDDTESIVIVPLSVEAKRFVMEQGGNEYLVEQIAEEIMGKGYTTIEEVEEHWKNYYAE